MTRYKNIFLTLMLAMMVIVALPSFAGKDPIRWQLNHGFQVPLTVSRTYAIVYTFTNQLPITLQKPIVISKSASPESEFSYADNCSGLKLTPNQRCTVVVSVTPATTGTKTVQLTIGGYDNNLVRLPVVSTNATGTSLSGVQASVTGWLFYQTDLGSSSDYTFTFTNYGSTEATNVVSTVTQSNGVSPTITVNTCMNGSNPGTIPSVTSSGFCTISGTYHATILGEQSVTGSITFDGSADSPAGVSTYTDVISPSTPGNLQGTLVTPDYLPPLMQQATSYPLAFLFTNVSNAQVDFSSTQVGSISCIDSHSVPCGSCDKTGCTGSVLSGFTSNCTTDLPYTVPAAACELTANFVSPTATNPATGYTITAAVPYQNSGGYSPAHVSTSGVDVATLPTTRTINIENHCGFTVWFSLHGGSVPGSCDKTSGVGCPPGTSCYKDKGTCFWANPEPNTTPSAPATAYELAPSAVNSVTIPAYDYNGGIQWSGNLSASALCDRTTSCVIAPCGNAGGSTSCKPGIGFTQPATEAEFTFNVASSDSYDVETINGYSIPISMKPFYYTGVPATPNGYTCGTPGAYGTAATNNGFGSCNWDTVSLPTPTGGTGYSSGYYWVLSNGTPCNITNAADQCGSGNLCGLSIDRTTNTFSQMCGTFLGYWTGDQVCSYSGLPATIDTFFNCSLVVSQPPISSTLPFPANTTLYDLMACHVPPKDPYPSFNSCYNSYSGATSSQIDTCCGCVNWWEAGVASNPNTQSCGSQIDPVWTGYIQSMVQWAKAACPSAYVYPFDDKTAGFTCSNGLVNEPNSTDYLITFCDGSQGLPTGITDGR